LSASGTGPPHRFQSKRMKKAKGHASVKSSSIRGDIQPPADALTLGEHARRPFEQKGKRQI
jgi:hypothetical protein